MFMAAALSTFISSALGPALINLEIVRQILINYRRIAYLATVKLLITYTHTIMVLMNVWFIRVWFAIFTTQQGTFNLTYLLCIPRPVLSCLAKYYYDYRTCLFYDKYSPRKQATQSGVRKPCWLVHNLAILSHSNFIYIYIYINHSNHNHPPETSLFSNAASLNY